MFFNINIQAQTTVVIGTVTNAGDGMVIPGVSVVVNGKSTGTITDMNGNYSIKANTGRTLNFGFVGMKSEQLKISISGLFWDNKN